MRAACLTAFFITASSPVFAEDYVSDLGRVPSEAGFEASTDMRIDLVKDALQLKPDKEKYWPAVADAIRVRAMA